MCSCSWGVVYENKLSEKSGSFSIKWVIGGRNLKISKRLLVITMTFFGSVSNGVNDMVNNIK